MIKQRQWQCQIKLS
ncbi:hypothetical protein [Lysinibacillus sp. FJAT-14745]